MSLLLLCAGVFVAPAAGQDFRGAITGRITDGTGAAVPGVTVTATNTATLVPTAVVSNETGNYSILFLTPGRCDVTAELGGFKTISREDIEVRIGDRLGLDLVMEVGDLEETISVTAATPLLNTTGGSLGQVIDERRISMLPLSDGNPFVLSRLVPGVAYTGDLKFSRPFDNAGSSAQFLLRRHRVAVRRVPGAGSVHGSHGETAQRGLLGPALAGHPQSTIRRRRS
jgi:hypothetical protein